MTCEECQDLLLLYVTGALEPGETAAVRAHLAGGCPACAGALASAEAAFHQVPRALPLEKAPDGAWEKLETRIGLAESPDVGPDRAALAAPFTPPRKSGGRWMGWAVAAAVAVVLGLMLKEAQEQRGRDQVAINTLTAAISGVQKDLERQVALAEKQASEIQALNQRLQVELYAVSSPTQPEARGKLVWDKATRSWFMYIDSAKALPAGKTYELWIVTAAGQKLASGVANPDAAGRLVFQTPVPAEAITLAAITDEAAGGVGDNKGVGEIQFLAKLAN